MNGQSFLIRTCGAPSCGCGCEWGRLTLETVWDDCSQLVTLCYYVLAMNTRNLAGQFARLPDGERVFIEMVGAGQEALPARAIVRRIEGENKNARAQCWVHLLEILGPEIPIEDEG